MATSEELLRIQIYSFLGSKYPFLEGSNWEGNVGGDAGLWGVSLSTFLYYFLLKNYKNKAHDDVHEK